MGESTNLSLEVPHSRLPARQGKPYKDCRGSLHRASVPLCLEAKPCPPVQVFASRHVLYLLVMPVL
jgi:hypothetical protein